eukprot:TRINITY_DN369_c7_g1_i1.p1 TRINITY_DN369_c7_g1~~TRINITY_DN369_c7_g1_i1.p1  ORF type:complete len:150 (+),score=49.62 TRINITY_DN369_c7_g1_i1:76-525(+)
MWGDGKDKGKGKGKDKTGNLWGHWNSWDPWSFFGPMGWSMMGGKGKGKDNIAKQTRPSEKVFIGGLPELGSEGLSVELNKKLREHCNQAGKCKYAECGRKGTGVACFTNREDAANAVTVLNGSVFDGNHVLEVKSWGKGPPTGEGEAAA